MPSSRTEPVPIFVIGRHRSGTTGLANHLCEHSQIAGVQHEAHGGIHESGYYPYVVDRYGPLQCRNNLQRFAEEITQSDYFRLAGANKDNPTSLHPTSYARLFGEVMCEFAHRHGAQYWLEKSPDHTKYARRIARDYPSAKFVGITRSVEDVVNSSIGLKIDATDPTRERLRLLLRLVPGWVYYTKCIRELRRLFPDRTHVVQYHDFLNHKRDVLKQICGFLDLEYEDALSTVPFSRNTGFPKGQTHPRPIGPAERRAVAAWAKVLWAVPYQLYRAADAVVNYFRSPHPFPPWFFKLSNRDQLFTK